MLIERHRAAQHRTVVEAILLAGRTVGLDNRQCIQVTIEPVARRQLEIVSEPIRNPGLRIEIEYADRLEADSAVTEL